MDHSVVGREYEYQRLNENFLNRNSGLTVVYGRRRIGKSFFLSSYCNEKHGLYFEGLEKQHTHVQINHFAQQLAQQIQDPLLKVAKFTTWEQVFDYLTLFFKKDKKKQLVIFDEFQWMAAGQSKLVSLLKYYWDNRWKQERVQLVLCGSISSFMIGKVIKSKALYGRIDLELNMGPLNPKDVSLMLKKKISQDEMLKYMLIFGGIPKYVELINTKHSFSKNIQMLCFDKDAYFATEFEKIFFSQFKKHRLHEKILSLLAKENLTLDEISKKLKVSSGGGLTRYLTELKDASFIRTASFEEKKGKKYKLNDEYLIFYFKFIRPHLKLIQAGQSRQLFTEQIQSVWTPWTGIAFENFCLKNFSSIARILDVEGKIKNFGPYRDKTTEGTQIDLLIQSTEKVLYVCDCKYYQKPVDSSIIKDFEKKLKALRDFKNYSVKKVLVSPNGVSQELKNSDYFDFIISTEDFFK